MQSRPMTRQPMLLAVLCAALLVSSCGPSTRSARVGLDLPAMDPRLTSPCPRPQALGTNGLSAGDVQRHWARDRAALVRCGHEKAALVEGYEALRGALAVSGR